MRGCSYRTVLSTLQRLTTVAEKVEVHRKFKKRGSTEVRPMVVPSISEGVRIFQYITEKLVPGGPYISEKLVPWGPF